MTTESGPSRASGRPSLIPTAQAERSSAKPGPGAGVSPPQTGEADSAEEVPDPGRWLLRNTDLLMLAAVAIVAVGTWVVIELADAVLEGSAQRYDDWVLAALRSPSDPSRPIGPAWFQAMWLDLTSLGSGSVLSLVTLGCAGYLLMAKRFRTVIVLAIVVIGGSILAFWMKSFFNRPRPLYAAAMPYIVTASFPSGHSMLSAVVYMTLAVLLARTSTQRSVRIFFITMGLIVTLLVGFSRVYLGVHYPTDVLMGWSAGLTWAMLCWLILYFLQRAGLIERPKPPEGADRNGR